MGQTATFDYQAFKAAFRQKALARGIDPVTGATGYQARMTAIALAKQWRVKLRFWTPEAQPYGPRMQPAAVAEPEPESADALPVDLLTLRALYPEAKAEWERARRHQRTLKQINAHRKAFELARERAIRGEAAAV